MGMGVLHSVCNYVNQLILSQRPNRDTKFVNRHESTVILNSSWSKLNYKIVSNITTP